MAYNGSGTFLINTAGQPVVSGTVISSTAFNSLTADLATGLSTAITKDGQTTVTANIPMSTYKFTGLGVGSAATDSANLSQVQSTVTKLLNSVSGADTITATASPTLAAYAAGQMFYFVAAGDNTTSVTLNIDSLGAKAVTRDGSVALAAADIKSGEVIVVVYDGTRFQVVSQLNSAGNATFANVSITSALNVGGVATFTNNPVLSGGTANGVLYLNGSKVATSGSALTFNGSVLATTGRFEGGANLGLLLNNATGAYAAWQYNGTNVGEIGTANQLIGGGGTDDFAINTRQAAGDIVFGINTSEAMRLTSTGLGIGTASPAVKLQVKSSAEAFRIEGTTARGSGNIFASFYDPSGRKGYWGYGASNDNLYIANEMNAAMLFLTNATVQATLDASGNLGLGVTPSAWSSGKAYETTAAGHALWALSNEINVTQNAYFNAGWKYGATAAAARYQQQAGEHKWHIAASGTAGNAISFTQAMTLDASGNLGVGTTAASNVRLHTYNTASIAEHRIECSTTAGVFSRWKSSAGDIGYFGQANVFVGGASSSDLGVASAVGNIVFATGATPAERARISSGGAFSVNTTSAGAQMNLYHNGATTAGFVIRNTDTGAATQNAILFERNTSIVGVITTTNTATAYVTSSDRRLKDNIAPADNAGSVIDAIEVVKHDWKAGGHTRYGMIAQDLHIVVPEAVSVGDADDVEDLNNPWGVDYSKLVPMLVKELQSLRKRVAELESK